MEDKTTEKKRKILSALITMLFSGAIMVVLLFFFGFKTPLPLPEEEGVIIEVGGGGGGGGGDYFPEDYYESSTDANSGNFSEDVVTDENSTAHVKGGQTSTGDNKDNTPKMDNRVTGFKWGQGNGQGPGSGGGTGTGDGPGDGPGTGPGTGGNGSGVGSLGAPKLVRNPDIKTQKEGFVVVTVWVNREGQVIDAEAGAIGTTISDAGVWKKCEIDAKKFNYEKNEKAPARRVGTIKFVFKNTQ